MHYFHQSATLHIYQRGQALIYGVFMLLIGLAALFFLFNTGQLSQEKTKLVSTADAVAYSAGVMHARTLNYAAYTNRAMIANTVAIAQLVSLSSWIQYTNSLTVSATVVGLDKLKYPKFYLPYATAVLAGPYLKEALVDAPTLEVLAVASDVITQGLSASQQISMNPALLYLSRKEVMQTVADANYQNNGSVKVDEIPLIDDSISFFKHYSDDERTRFAETVRSAANQDSFVRSRAWSMNAAIPSYRCLFTSYDRLERSGQTQLAGFDEWRANDKISEFQRYKSGGIFSRCKTREILNGIGSQQDTKEPVVSYTSRSWHYSGLPSFYDLSEKMLKDPDPRLTFAIRVRRPISETATSEARSQIKTAAPSHFHLNEYQAAPASSPQGKELVAVSASEVYFERPPSHEENSFGAKMGKSQELGSLFNPYWQVRLIHSEKAVQAAQALQGVVIP